MELEQAIDIRSPVKIWQMGLENMKSKRKATIKRAREQLNRKRLRRKRKLQQIRTMNNKCLILPLIEAYKYLFQ